MKRLLIAVLPVVLSLFVGVPKALGITISCSGQVNTNTGAPVEGARVSIEGGMGPYSQACGTVVDVYTDASGAWSYSGPWDAQCYVNVIRVRKDHYLPDPKNWPRLPPNGPYFCNPGTLIISPIATPTSTATLTPTPGGPTPTDAPTPTPGGPTPTSTATLTPTPVQDKYICHDPTSVDIDERCKVDPGGTFDTQYECWFDAHCGGPLNPGCGGHFDVCCPGAPQCRYANEVCTGGYCVPAPPPIPTDLPCVSQNKIPTAIGCIAVKNSNDFIGSLLKVFLGIGGGIAFLLMLFGSFKIILSGGNKESLQAGKELITSAIAGLLMIIFSVYVLELVGTKILGLPGF